MPRHRSGANAKSNKTSANTRSTLETDAQSSHSDLLEVERLLHLLWHRNKNQHRNQKWWKWLAILRRSTKKLLAFEVEGAKRGWRRREEEREKDALEGWVRAVVLPEGWMAFSTLVADNQFSTLGVVLIAVLARMGRVIGLPESRAQSPPSVATNIDAKVPLASTLPDMVLNAGELALRGGLEDAGEMIQRNTESEDSRSVIDIGKSETGNDWLKGKDHVLEKDARPVQEDEQKIVKAREKSTQQKKQQPRLQNRSRKRRKKSNAIDELFGDLVG